MPWGHDRLSKMSKQAVMDFIFFPAESVTFSFRFLEHWLGVWVGYGVLLVGTEVSLGSYCNLTEQ